MPKNKPKHPERTSAAQPAPRPTNVKIGFYNLVIKWIPEAEWREPNGMDPGLQGQFDANVGRISMRVQTDVHEQMLRETLWHEILHGCWWHMGLTDHPVTDKDGEEQEEQIVKRITHASLQVIQDNPDVMAYLGAQLWQVKVRG